MKQVALRLDDELAALIDQAAGQVPRERWIKNTLRAALGASSDPMPSTSCAQSLSYVAPPPTPRIDAASLAARQARLNQAKERKR